MDRPKLSPVVIILAALVLCYFVSTLVSGINRDRGHQAGLETINARQPTLATLEALNPGVSVTRSAAERAASATFDALLNRTPTPTRTPRPGSTARPQAAESDAPVLFRLDDYLNLHAVFPLALSCGVWWLIGMLALKLYGDGLNRQARLALHRALQRGVPLADSVPAAINRRFLRTVRLMTYGGFAAYFVVTAGVFGAVFDLAGTIRAEFGSVLNVAISAFLLYHLYRALQTLLYPTPREHDAGTEPLELPRADEPEIWRVIDECAAVMGVPPFDQVFLGWAGEPTARPKLVASGVTKLHLGMATLNEVSEAQLRALLCQQYAFVHLTPLRRLLQLNERYLRSASALMEHIRRSGGLHIVNPVYLPLFVGITLLAQVTSGATRFWTLLADRAAADKVGAAVLITALQQREYADFAFEVTARDHIAGMRMQARPVENLYDLPVNPVRIAEMETWLSKRPKNLAAKLFVAVPPTDERVALLHPLMTDEPPLMMIRAVHLLFDPLRWQLPLSRVYQQLIAAERFDQSRYQSTRRQQD